MEMEIEKEMEIEIKREIRDGGRLRGIKIEIWR